jgi:hypothetical protein
MQYTSQYLGVPIRDKCYVFGGNKSVVDSSMQLNAKLHKWYTMLSLHHAEKLLHLEFLVSTSYQVPPDILSKH